MTPKPRTKPATRSVRAYMKQKIKDYQEEMRACQAEGRCWGCYWRRQVIAELRAVLRRLPGGKR